MNALAQALKGQFVIADLGSAGDRDYRLAPDYQKATTLIDIDAGGDSRAAGEYFARHAVKQVIAGEKGRRRFFKNAFDGSSTLLEPDSNLIKAYGLEKYYQVVSAEEVGCTTLPDVLAQLKVDHIDFLKTDLEGMDFEVIRSLGPLLDNILAIQCELHFQPFHREERPYHEIAQYLYSRGFELIAFPHIEYWKYDTPNRGLHTDGRVVWADCLFFKTLVLRSPPDGGPLRRVAPEALPARGTSELPLSRAKQILIASLLGRRGFAEHLFEIYKPFPAEWDLPIRDLIAPKPAWKGLSLWEIVRLVKDGAMIGLTRIFSRHYAAR